MLKIYYLFSIILMSFALKGQNCNQLYEHQPNCNILNKGQWISAYPVMHNCSPNTHWELVLEDDFNGNALDANKWNIGLGWNSNMIVGPALEYWTKDGSNLEVSNGTLKSIARQETKVANVFDYCPDICEPCADQQAIDDCILQDGIPNKRTFYFTSGVIETKAAFSPGHKVEIMCKIPEIDGVWPAFWLLSPCGQELDVFEFSNYDEFESTLVSSKRPYFTYHKEEVCGDKGTICHDGKYLDCINYSQGWHKFSAEWDAYKITWFIDDIPVRNIYGLVTMNGQYVDECNLAVGSYLRNSLMPTLPMTLIIGMGVKIFGTPPYGVLPDLSYARGTYPSVFEIDYVKVYKRVPNEACNGGNIIVNTTTNSGILNYAQAELRVSGSIITSGNVNIVTNKHWVAGNYIDLMQGLEVWPVTDFTAEIEPCNSSNRMLHMDTVILTCPIDTLRLLPAYNELNFISYLWDFGNGETSNEETGSFFMINPVNIILL